MDLIADIDERVRAWPSRTLPLRVACFIGAADSLVALATAVTSRPDPASIWLGFLWLALWTVALVRADRIASAMENHPRLVWLLPPLAFACMLPALLDGGYPGSLATQPIWLVAVAAALSRWPVVLATGLLAFAAKALVFWATGTGPEPFGEGAPLEARTALLLPLALVPLAIALIASIRPLVALAGASSSSGPSDLRSELTPAQREIVDLLASGLTAKEIALRRGTSAETVRTQIKQARKKVGAKTKDELVASTWRPM